MSGWGLAELPAKLLSLRKKLAKRKSSDNIDSLYGPFHVASQNLFLDMLKNYF